MELRVAPEELYLAMTMSNSLASSASTNSVAQLMFESCNVPVLCIQNSSAMSVKGIGRDTGMCVDAGAGGIYAVPVVNGKAVSEAAQVLNFGGRDLNELLIQKLNLVDKKHLISYEKLEALKAAHWLVAAQESEASTGADTIHQLELKDGTSASVSEAMLQSCSEEIFKPVTGIAQLTSASIKSAAIAFDESIQNELFSNILVTGGTSLLKGFASRLASDVQVIEPSQAVNVYQHDQALLSAWSGMNAEASTGAVPYVSKQEYDEIGASVLERWLQ